jgi:hypothetical protein
MSDFLRDLVGRTLGVREVLQPRPGSAFERPAADAGPSVPRPPREPVVLEAVGEAVATALRATPGERRPQPAPAVPRDAAHDPIVGGDPEPAATKTPSGHPAEPAAAPAASEPPPAAPLEPRVTERPVREPAQRGHATGQGPPTEAATAALPGASPQAAPVAAEPAAAARVVDPHVVEQTASARERIVVHERAPAPTPRVRRRAAEPPAAEPEPGPEPEPEPVVHVHIGRIEVRAPAVPPGPQAPRPREPSLSLADYLAQTSARHR